MPQYLNTKLSKANLPHTKLPKCTTTEGKADKYPMKKLPKCKVATVPICLNTNLNTAKLSSWEMTGHRYANWQDSKLPQYCSNARLHGDSVVQAHYTIPSKGEYIPSIWSLFATLVSLILSKPTPAVEPDCCVFLLQNKWISFKLYLVKKVCPLAYIHPWCPHLYLFQRCRV